jgi:hypothetical protein
MLRFLTKYWMVAGAGLLLCTVRLLLRWRSLPQVLDVLNRAAGTVRRDIATLEPRIYYVDRWLEVFPYNTKGNCFPRALALYWLARRVGCPVRFCCGIKREDAKLDGHAWLTLDQKPFHELSEQWRQYTVTFSYPDPPDDRTGAGHRPLPEDPARVA